MGLIKEIIYRLRGEYTTEKLMKMGMRVGKNFHRLNGVILDPSHCWLITIGNNVTLAPRVHILCHDASTKQFLGYTKLGCVTIGDNVFLGAGTIVLPGISIGSNVVIGANSTVTHSIPDNSVAIGTPARVVCTLEEYLKKETQRMNNSIIYSEEFTLNGKITDAKKAQQRIEIQDSIGYII